MRWPKELPLLGPDDFCRRRLNSEDGQQHCLVGWMHHLFEDASARLELFGALWDACGEAVNVFNNTQPLEKVAQLWNRTVARIAPPEVNLVPRRELTRASV